MFTVVLSTQYFCVALGRVFFTLRVFLARLPNPCLSLTVNFIAPCLSGKSAVPPSRGPQCADKWAIVLWPAYLGYKSGQAPTQQVPFFCFTHKDFSQ